MLKIRLQRIGKKKEPKFRMVLINSRRAPKSGAFLELLGLYDPARKNLTLKKERIQELLKNGAVFSKTAEEMFKKHKLTA